MENDMPSWDADYGHEDYWGDVPDEDEDTEGAREGLTPDVRADLIAAVSGLVGDDGTGDLGVIVDTALGADPDVTAEDVAVIVREARRDAQDERAREVKARL